MEIITFINSAGNSIEFSAEFPYKLGDTTGIGEMPTEPQMDEVYGIDGDVYYDTLADNRPVRFDFWFNGTTEADLLTTRRLIQKYLNPKLGEGILVYENNNAKYRVNAAVFDGPVMLTGAENRTPLCQHVEVAFLCAQPLWESYIEYSVKIVGKTGGLAFPLEFPISFATLADNVEIDNQGDNDTPVRIEFRGPATLCKITKVETGEYVEVTHTLEANEKLIIDTNERLPTVTFVSATGVETSAFNKINAASDFFVLTPGVNTMAFTSATGTPEVYIFWRHRYSGV